MLQHFYHRRSALKAASITQLRCSCCNSTRCCRGYVVVPYRQQSTVVNPIVLFLTLLIALMGVQVPVPGGSTLLQSSSTQTPQGDCNFLVYAWVAISLYPKMNHLHNRHQELMRQLQHPHLQSKPSADIVVMMAKVESGNDEFTASDMDDDEIIETNEAAPTTTTSNNDIENNTKLMERVWRYNKKPLLSIGAQKGPTSKHGNSLRELLQHHVTVKVKTQLLFNASNRNDDPQSIQDQMIQVYNQLKVHTINADPTLQDMELLQVRANERILLVGLPGTTQKIMDGTYPPPPPPPRNTTMEEDQTTTATNI